MEGGKAEREGGGEVEGRGGWRGVEVEGGGEIGRWRRWEDGREGKGGGGGGGGGGEGGEGGGERKVGSRRDRRGRVEGGGQRVEEGEEREVRICIILSSICFADMSFWAFQCV